LFTRTSRAKRRIGAAVLAALVGSLLAFASPSNAGPTTASATDRLSGANRYATAADVAQDAAWGTNEAGITVVNGDNFPDGLAAAALGKRILLVRADSIPAETEAAIKALEAALVDAAVLDGGDGDGTNDGVMTITVVGGTGVVSSAVLEQLDALNGDDPVVRISGADRYATALAVAKVEDPTAAQGLIIATGTNFPDALAAGPLAANKNMGIVLVQGSSLSAAVKAHVALVPADKTIYIVGGTGAVSQSIQAEILGMGKTVKRLSGADREATAVAIAGERGTDGDNSAVLVNRGGFADALAAGPFAALPKVSGSIMLVGTDSVPTATANWHAAKCLTLGETGAPATNAKVYAIGGTGVISDAVQTAAVAATKCPAVTFTATVANSAYVQATTELIQDDGGLLVDGPTAGKGVKLTAVAGSDADGAKGNTYRVAINDSATAVTPSTALTVAAGVTTITLTVEIPAAGLTQAAMAAAWNSTDGAALFTATPTATSVAGYANFVDDGNVANADISAAAPTNGAQTQTVVVTFNQAVKNAAGAVATSLETTDFTIAGDDTIDAFSPVAAAGSATTYTITYAGVTNAANILVAGVSTVVMADGTTFSAATDLKPAITPVKMTAG